MDKTWYEMDKMKLLSLNVSVSTYQNLLCPHDSNLKVWQDSPCDYIESLLCVAHLRAC